MKRVYMEKLFPLSSRYNESWVRRNSLGENVLYNLECLCEILNMNSGMKILDLGCGKAISAIFLANEFNSKVWAVDPKMNPSSNLIRIREMGCEENVLPLKLEANALPFPEEFFDLIIAVDSFMYFGTDFGFTDYITKFLKPGGQIGIVDICTHNEQYEKDRIAEKKINIDDNPDYIKSLDWWSNLWNDCPDLDLKFCEIVPENDVIIKEYIKDFKYSNKTDMLADELDHDENNLLKIFRMSAVKKLKSDNFYNVIN
ncbi:MAG TPA: methyltransferase domain-containing protein [Ignavibacteria bacterium]|nr:methyltransferase domain-containing protein [Ignavibacteria bacterium]